MPTTSDVSCRRPVRGVRVPVPNAPFQIVATRSDPSRSGVSPVALRNACRRISYRISLCCGDTRGVSSTAPRVCVPVKAHRNRRLQLSDFQRWAPAPRLTLESTQLLLRVFEGTVVSRTAIRGVGARTRGHLFQATAAPSIDYPALRHHSGFNLSDEIVTGRSSPPSFGFVVSAPNEGMSRKTFRLSQMASAELVFAVNTPHEHFRVLSVPAFSAGSEELQRLCVDRYPLARSVSALPPQ